MDKFGAIRRIARAALHLRDSELQGALATLQAARVRPAEEAAPQRRPAPGPGQWLRPREELSFRHDVLWRRDGDLESGPLCPACWGREHRAVLMQARAGSWSCPACDRDVRMPGFPEGGLARS